MHRFTVLSVSVLVAMSGCSFLSAARGMKDTTVSSVPDNYDKLIAAATTLGWKSQKGTGKRDSLDDWDLQVFPAAGQTIMFTRNNKTTNISFNCKGGPLDDKQACINAADQLLLPAFGGKYGG